MPGARDVLIWIGFDDRGEELEIAGFEAEDGAVVIIHAMPTKYRR
jgi:hypothetical protein